jgi:hypothetical protein
MWIPNNTRTAALLVGGSVLALVAVGGVAPRVGALLAPVTPHQEQPSAPSKLAPANASA